MNNERDLLQDYGFIQSRLDRNHLLKEATTNYDDADKLLRRAVSKHTNLSKFLRDIVKYTKEMLDIFDTYNMNFIMSDY